MGVTVFADDLSGANTIAALFHKQGWHARVHLSRPETRALSNGMYAATGQEVHVWNTGTRNTADEAAGAVFREMLQVAGQPEDLVAFRVDSTLRGPIAASLGALLDAFPNHAAMVVPAYPDSGRTTRDGIHRVHGTPVHETPAGNDPFAPVPTSDIRVCIGAGCGHASAHLSLDALHRNRAEAVAALGAAVDAGVRVLLCDAESNDDIETLAELGVSLARSGWPVLSVDPGPFSVALATRLVDPTDVRPVVLGISASIMYNARAQMDYLEYTLGLGMVHYAGQPVDEVMARLRASTNERLGPASSIRPGTTLFLRTDTWKLAQVAAEHVVHGLPDIVTAALEEFPSLRGFYFSGGEAAATILKGVGVSTLAMEMEVAPLTTMSRPLDGLLKGTYVVTKGGAIGDERAVVDALVRLHEVALRSP